MSDKPIPTPSPWDVIDLCPLCGGARRPTSIVHTAMCVRLRRLERLCVELAYSECPLPKELSEIVQEMKRDVEDKRSAT